MLRGLYEGLVALRPALGGLGLRLWRRAHEGRGQRELVSLELYGRGWESPARDRGLGEAYILAAELQ
eukprot:1684375-Pyramimonas_sp.AAC.1